MEEGAAALQKRRASPFKLHVSNLLGNLHGELSGTSNEEPQVVIPCPSPPGISDKSWGRITCKISSTLPSISQSFTDLSGLCIVPRPLYFYTVAPRKSQPTHPARPKPTRSRWEGTALALSCQSRQQRLLLLLTGG